ncbi:hypothetical protein BLNAU_12024 [Blattamonas nauphoetae]|uniref:Uncharacterized protein n=1 Tax=Blattamonas nauphoetae TaxID=2049346 RepID=A0ABQ9XRU7_9EUKA|nr:hypothetical protein BLNAU_12024 [Blattamonas nauphoetae]
MVWFVGTIGILSRQSHSMVANLSFSFSFAATLALSKTTLRNNRVEAIQGDLGWDEQVDDEGESGRMEWLKDVDVDGLTRFLSEHPTLHKILTFSSLSLYALAGAFFFFVEQANNHRILFLLSLTRSSPRPRGEASFSWLHMPLRFPLSLQRDSESE